MLTTSNLTHTFARKSVRRVAIAALLAVIVAPLFPLKNMTVNAAPSSVSLSSDPFILDSGVVAIVDGSGQQSGAGSFTNGGSITDYPEGACLPVLVTVSQTDAVPANIDFDIVYDYTHPSTDAIGIADLEMVTPSFSGDPSALAVDLSDFSYSASPISGATSFESETGSVSATISGPFADDSGTDPTTATDDMRHYHVILDTVDPDTDVYVLFCGRFSVDAGDFPGATMQIRMSEGGGGTTSINPNNLLFLPSLTLSKVVSSGAAAPDEFSFVVSPAINGETVFDIPLGETSVVIDNISPDGVYSVTETGPAGYSFVSGTGTNCSFTGETASATVAAGDTATDASCEFTNAVGESTITVEKIVVNDNGGTAVVADFPLFVDATAVDSGVATSFPAGDYLISETNLPGYTATFSGACDSTGALTLGEAEDLVCTITNDDILVLPTTGSLTVIKDVVTDNGGTETADDFTITVRDDADAEVDSFPGDEAGTTITDLAPGTYTVEETGPSGYTADWSQCGDGTVTIVAGETATCTIVNDDEQASITVVKNVINDDGGTSVAGDFTIMVTSGIANMDMVTGDEAGTTISVDAGAFSISEMPNPMYTPSYSGTCSGTLLPGESVTCTVTNDDFMMPAMPSMGAITKVVINDDEGTAIVSDFDLFVDTTPVESGMPTLLMPGTYTVSESGGPGGYTASFSGDCDANGTLTVSMMLPFSCIITNDDDEPQDNGGGGNDDPTTGTLTVIKVVSSGQGVPSDFLITVSDDEDFSEEFAGSSDGEVLELDPGAYQVEEVPETNYTPSFSGDCDSEGNVTVEAGESYTCTVTNAFTPVDEEQEPETATLIIVKHVINDNGGNESAGEFSLDVSGVNPSLTVVTGSEVGVEVTLDPGDYSVTESNTRNYTVSYSDDCSGSIEAGETRTCTVTNDDVRRSGGGGGSNGGSSNNDDETDEPAEEPEPTLPEPRVLGETDEPTPVIEPVVTPVSEPVPEVLGAVDALPTTGMPPAALLLLTIPALWAARKRK